MFEFDFDKKGNYKGIEKDIKDYHTKDRIPLILKIGLSSLIGSILTLAVINIYNITNLFIMFASIIPFSIISSCIIEFTSKSIKKNKKNNAKVNLDSINSSCKKNNILTNTENLSNSIVIKQNNRELSVFNDDGIVESKEVVIDDNYYLFLDNKEDLNGILERKTLNRNNSIIQNDTSYYLLENDEIKELEKRIVKVKKLVKKI